MSAALLSLLTPKSVNLGGSRGGIPELAASDIARGLAGCPCAYSYTALMAKLYFNPRSKPPYLGEGDVKGLKQAVYALTLCTLYREQWEPPAGYIRGSKLIAEVVSAQFLGGYICHVCAEVGEIEGAKVRSCTVCNDSKTGCLPDYIRASLAEIPLKEYQTKWIPRIDVIEREVNSWEQIGLDTLRRNLGDTV